jgi:hypothetical protein
VFRLRRDAAGTTSGCAVRITTRQFAVASRCGGLFGSFSKSVSSTRAVWATRDCGRVRPDHAAARESRPDVGNGVLVAETTHIRTTAYDPR